MENRENDFPSQIFNECESVEQGWVKYRNVMERESRCSYEDFTTPEAFNKNHILKPTLAKFVHNCYKAVDRHRDLVTKLKSIIDGLIDENFQLMDEKTQLVNENSEMKEIRLQLLEELSCSKSAEIQSQNSIISLQKELLDCKRDRLESVQCTVSDAVKTSVQSEIKLFSQVVTTSAGASSKGVQDVKTLKSAVKDVVQAEDRGKNLIIFGMSEEPQEDTRKKISELLDYLGEKPRHESVRIGVKKSELNRQRPVKVTLASSAHVIQVLRAAKKLKDSDKFSSVFICPDRTTEERKLRKQAVIDLKKKLTDEPRKRHFIRGFKVVTASEG